MPKMGGVLRRNRRVIPPPVGGYSRPRRIKLAAIRATQIGGLSIPGLYLSTVEEQGELREKSNLRIFAPIAHLLRATTNPYAEPFRRCNMAFKDNAPSPSTFQYFSVGGFLRRSLISARKVAKFDENPTAEWPILSR